jgi:hypothetical protein
MAIDADSPDSVLILRWILRLAAFLLLLHAVTTLSSHQTVAYGSHGTKKLTCPQVLHEALNRNEVPLDTSGQAVPAAEGVCARVATSDAKSSGAGLGAAIVLAAVSFIPWARRNAPARGWVKVDGEWYPPWKAPASESPADDHQADDQQADDQQADDRPAEGAGTPTTAD